MLFLVADYLAGVTIGTITAIAVRGKPDLDRDTLVIPQKAGCRARWEENMRVDDVKDDR
jgi:hypothetical protein